MSKPISRMTQAELACYFPTFINASGLPIHLETWQYIDGMNSLEYVLVKPGELYVMPSTNGEWYLQTYLDEKNSEVWKNAGIETGYPIGKFRDKPCASGDYSWMEDEKFDILYNKEEKTATFIRVSSNPAKSTTHCCRTQCQDK